MTVDGHLSHSQLNLYSFPLCTMDIDGRFLFVNESFKERFGYSNDWLQGSFSSLVKAEDVNVTIENLALARAGQIQTFEVTILDQSKHEHRLQAVTVPIVSDSVTAAAVHLVLCDAARQPFVEKELFDAKEQLNLIFESLDVSLWAMDVTNNEITQFSPATEKIYGVPKEKFLENPRLWKELVHREDLPALEASQSRLLKGIPIVSEYRIVRPDGTIRWLYDRVIPQLNSQRQLTALTGIGIDITERKQMEEEVELAACFDSLTKLPNRKWFENKLNELLLLNEEKRAILHLDIDRFKTINDTLGSGFGDDALIEIAARLESCIPEGHYVARTGDDEFIILSERDSVSRITELAENILKSIGDAPLLIRNHEFFVTASIGISMFPDDGTESAALMKNANTALIWAKEQGKNRFEFYTSDMNMTTYRRFTLERDLRKAVVRDELILHYQPRLDTLTHQINSVEALLRWNHPDWGVISPLECIPLAEETGLILPVGEWILREACTQCKSWNDTLLSPVGIAVNISPKQLLQKNIEQIIINILEETKLEPNYLELEITENLLMHSEHIAVLKGLQERGVLIAIDDFGMGYSSLQYLKMFKANTLKIDKSFIHNTTSSTVDAAIVSAVLNLARELEMNVVAEGVETQEQLAFLQRNQCDEIQGYLFSRPVKAEEMSKLLLNGKCVIQEGAESVSEFINQREYFRVELKHPLLAYMTIKEIRGKQVQIGYTPILIENIGAGGILFYTNLDFSIHKNVIYQFRIEMMGSRFDLFGQIIWRSMADDSLRANGVSFIINEFERNDLIKVLNQLTIQIKKSPIVPDCNLILMEKAMFFNNQDDSHIH